jgi:hypothetical protein
MTVTLLLVRRSAAVSRRHCPVLVVCYCGAVVLLIHDKASRSCRLSQHGFDFPVIGSLSSFGCTFLFD